MNGLTQIANLPRWGVMWGLAIVVFSLLKLLSWRSRRTVKASLCRHIGYLFGWPGMDVDTFLSTSDPKVARPSINEWAFATLKMLLGLGIIVTAAWSESDINTYWRGWLGMIGTVFALHFGLFHVLSCAWRAGGVAAVPLMDWPVASQSLAEFWGRRWNLAFRDLTHRFIFRPLQRPLGPIGALLTGFLLSGLVHDLVISLPAGGGYGLPTIYFVIQGAGIIGERTITGRRFGLGKGVIGRTYCLTLLIGPVGLLFHRPFVCDVIVPFLKVIGGLW